MHSDFLISVAAETSSATPPLLKGFPAARAFIALAAAFIAFIGRTMAGAQRRIQKHPRSGRAQ